MSTNQKKIFVKLGYKPHEYIAYIGEEQEEVVINIDGLIPYLERHEIRPTEHGEYATITYLEEPTDEEEYEWLKENIHEFVDTIDSQIEFD